MHRHYIIISVIFLLAGCNHKQNKVEYVDDNLIEELVETVIEHYTGLDLDFTPNSPEHSLSEIRDLKFEAKFKIKSPCGGKKECDDLVGDGKT